jgi:hypothetical protein
MMGSTDIIEMFEAVSYLGELAEVVLVWTDIDENVLVSTNDGRLIVCDSDGTWTDRDRYQR